LENAGDLLDEADLLLSRGHYARTYFLAHIACEEMAKAPMLFRVASELALDLPQDWRKIDRRLRNHRDKIRNVLTMDYFMSEIRPDDSDYHKYEADLANVPLLNEAKNDSLYCRGGRRRFHQPFNAHRSTKRRDVGSSETSSASGVRYPAPEDA
jgi:AbiV family abortive infection protein